jgi:hypothetical protein
MMIRRKFTFSYSFYPHLLSLIMFKEENICGYGEKKGEKNQKCGRNSDLFSHNMEGIDE